MCTDHVLSFSRPIVRLGHWTSNLDQRTRGGLDDSLLLETVDLRERVVTFVAAVHSRRAAARHFAVGDSPAIRLLQRIAATGSCKPDRQRRPPGTGKLAPYTAFLIGAVEAKPDITMPELRAAGARTSGTLWRAIGGVCDLFRPQECWNYLAAAGCALE